MDRCFKRMHNLPNKFFKYYVKGTVIEQLKTLSARQQYIFDSSYKRFAERDDAFIDSGIIVGEIGKIDGVRFIESPKLQKETK